MDFRLLGPLEADDGGAAVGLGGAKQRALLALAGLPGTFSLLALKRV